MRVSTSEGMTGERLSSDSTSACMVSLDRSLRIVAANQEMFRRFHRTDTASICGSSFCTLVHPSIRTRLGNQLERLLDGQQPRVYERSVALLGPDSTVWGDLMATATARDAGRVEGVMAVLRPVEGDAGPMAGRGAPRKILSDMDARILEGVASGASTVQLASTLFLSRGGVEYHVTALLRKMKVKNRPALISKAYSMGFFELGSWPPQVVPDHVK
ncbi:SelRIV [Pseudonocardia sp. HH130629-09]|nr:SelRIV [Pseudonocardia sp. HH130629-09]